MLLHIELLGEMRITVDGKRRENPTSVNARLLLARIAASRGNLARDALAEEFWDSGLQSARASLSTELKNLRRTLGSGAGLLATTRNQVGLPQCEELRIDVREFDEQLAAERYEQALELWRGDFLQDTGGAHAEVKRGRYRRKAAHAVAALADARERAGDLLGAADLARRQQELLPDDLDPVKRLLRVLDAAGEALQAEAERSALLNRYGKRGGVPPAILEIVRPDASQPAPPRPRPLPTETIPPETAAPEDSELDEIPDGAPSTGEYHEAKAAEDLLGSIHPPSPLYTGFVDLDQLLGGLPEPGLTVIAGRPGMGATTLALSIATNAAIGLGTPTALFSIESSEAQLAQRLVGMRARIPGAELRRGVAEQNWPKLLRASQQLASAPLWIDDSPQLDVKSVVSRIERLRGQSATRLVIIDSIHGLTVDGRPALEPVSIAAALYGLRAAARQLDVSIIVTMEVSGQCENRMDKRPLLQDLPGYYEVAAQRDLVLLLHRDEYYYADSDRVAEMDVIVAENRNGPVGRAVLTFMARIPVIMNLYTGSDPPSVTRDPAPVELAF
jgi:DnaB-like helicase C terminal domain/Bacterial transcriptional activator domain